MKVLWSHFCPFLKNFRCYESHMKVLRKCYRNHSYQLAPNARISSYSSVVRCSFAAASSLVASSFIERSCPFSTTALVPTQSIYDTTYTYDFYDAGTYLDCSVGCYFGVVGASEPIWWSATTQVTIPNL